MTQSQVLGKNLLNLKNILYTYWTRNIENNKISNVVLYRFLKKMMTYITILYIIILMANLLNWSLDFFGTLFWSFLFQLQMFRYKKQPWNTVFVETFWIDEIPLSFRKKSIHSPMKTRTINAPTKLDRKKKNTKKQHKQQPRKAEYTMGVSSRTSKILRKITKEDFYESETWNFQKSKSFRRYSSPLFLRHVFWNL